MNEISTLVGSIWTFKLLLAAIIVFPSGLIQRYACFGGALSSIPFFAILSGPVTGFAIVLFIVVLGQGILFLSVSKKVDWSEVGPLSTPSAITISCGILFLVSADQ
jgi:hypothetical protein